MLIAPLGTNTIEIWIKTQQFSYKKVHLKCRLRDGLAILIRPQCVKRDTCANSMQSREISKPREWMFAFSHCFRNWHWTPRNRCEDRSTIFQRSENLTPRCHALEILRDFSCKKTRTCYGVMSGERHGVSDYRSFECLFNSLLDMSSKKHQRPA